jgi:hypothetical protein
MVTVKPLAFNFRSNIFPIATMNKIVFVFASCMAMSAVQCGGGGGEEKV